MHIQFVKRKKERQSENGILKNKRSFASCDKGALAGKIQKTTFQEALIWDGFKDSHAGNLPGFSCSRNSSQGTQRMPSRKNRSLPRYSSQRRLSGKSSPKLLSPRRSSGRTREEFLTSSAYSLYLLDALTRASQEYMCRM